MIPINYHQVIACTLAVLSLPLFYCGFGQAHAEVAPVFVDRSDAAPIHVYAGGWEHFVGGGVAVFDCNDDMHPDLFVAGGDNAARLLINRTRRPGAPIVFASADIAPITGVTGAYPIDIDSDGLLDLAVLRVGQNILLRGSGDCVFEDASQEWGFRSENRWTTAFSATWQNGQSWPTLAFGNYVDRTDPEGPFGTCDKNLIYRPDGSGYGSAVPLAPGYCALSMLISDWQRSGSPELRISNDRHYYIVDGHEEMWRLDPLSPRDEADGWAKVSLWGMGIASADITGDGLPEVMLTSMGDQLLQFNDGSGFRNAPFSIGTYAQRPHVGDDGRPSTGWHAEFGDLNNDGRLDLFIAKGNVDQMPSNAIEDPNNLLMQTSKGDFVEIADQVGLASTERSRGAALADLNLDGLLDIVVVNRRAPIEIWQNATFNPGNWMAVDLRQDGTNTRAVGAWIELRVEKSGAVQTREVTIGGGHGGGQAGPLHFGLGTADSAQVRVIWPDGGSTAWIGYDANQRVLVHRAKVPSD